MRLKWPFPQPPILKNVGDCSPNPPRIDALTLSPYIYNRVYSELTTRNPLYRSRLACSRLSGHIQPSVNRPECEQTTYGWRKHNHSTSELQRSWIKLVRPLTTVENTRYARVFHSRLCSNYNIGHVQKRISYVNKTKCSNRKLSWSSVQNHASHLDRAAVSALWSDPVCRGCDQSERSRSRRLKSLAKWVASRRTRCHSAQTRWGQLRWDEMRWDEMWTFLQWSLWGSAIVT